MPDKSDNMLDRLLANYDVQQRERILEIVNAFGLKKDDPVFLLMVGTSAVQTLVEDAPKRIEHSFEYAQQQIDEHLEGYQRAARTGVENKVAESAQRLIEQTKENKAKIGLVSISAGSIAILATLAVGIAGGFAFQEATTKLDPRGRVQLTLEEAKALEWAKSKEGQYARKLLRWNEQLLGDCQQQVRELGITLKYGARKAKSGFCLVWTKPPSQREWVQQQN
jgi:hypothetical protein